MQNTIQGIHHVTAIAGNAKRNLDFYTNVLGLRLVKKSVNFDDPGTYHFYFGNESGAPGTILTFFPWEGISQGRRGTGQVTETTFSVPAGSFDFWIERFEKENVIYNKPSKRFDESYLVFNDPDGLKLELVANSHDRRKPFLYDGMAEAAAIRGFFGVTLSVEGYESTAKLLTELFGYKKTNEYANRFRFETDVVENASVVDLVCLPLGQTGVIAGGSVHHVAFRVADDETQQYYRKELIRMGFNVTPQVDRRYFKSIYFRESGGVLFEIATVTPGFTLDEPLAELGTSLKLPPQYESHRSEIEAVLPVLE